MAEAPAPVLGMILKGFPRISETFISNEILLLEDLGFKVHLFSMRQPRESFRHESVGRIRAALDYLPETLLAPLPRLLYHAGRLAARRPAAMRRALATALRRFLRTRRSATLKHLLQAGYLVDRLLPKSGVTHLHAHFAHSPASVALFASRLSGLPFSFTAHAKDIYTSDPRQLREKIALARFVVTCTGYNRRHLLRLSDGRTPIHRIYHGIDTRLFASEAQEVGAGPPAAPYRLLTVARLTAKKGLPTVYRALRRLRDQGLRLRHTLIGDGEERAAILALIRRLGLGADTELLGTLPHEAVLAHYRRADLLVLGCEVAPNGDRDGIPNVLLEAMAMAVPVVATRVSAIPELVRHGQSGLLVPPGDPAALAGAMTRLLTDQPLRRRVIRAGRQQVRTGFDNRVLVRRLAAVYRAGMNGFGPRPAGGF
ncbi:MAG: glycosyltransferase [Desulfobacteraceae bacterium]|jgi:glycosyltransferase involved in cell wall biosynthesis